MKPSHIQVLLYVFVCLKTESPFFLSIICILHVQIFILENILGAMKVENAGSGLQLFSKTLAGKN